MLRLIVACETSIPPPSSCSNASQCSSKVRSGSSFSCPGSHSLKAEPPSPKVYRGSFGCSRLPFDASC